MSLEGWIEQNKANVDWSATSESQRDQWIREWTREWERRWGETGDGDRG